jgi:hypothetical protein
VAELAPAAEAKLLELLCLRSALTKRVRLVVEGMTLRRLAVVVPVLASLALRPDHVLPDLLGSLVVDGLDSVSIL